jgi:hypothetical protein
MYQNVRKYVFILYSIDKPKFYRELVFGRKNFVEKKMKERKKAVESLLACTYTKNMLKIRNLCIKMKNLDK